MTTSKNTVTRGTYSPTEPAKAPHLHLVSDKCKCGKEIVGNHKTCGQCNLLDQAKIHGQELFTCMICEAPTPFDFCWHCNRKPADVKAAARKAYDAKQPVIESKAEVKAAATSKPVSAPPAEPVVATQPETPKTTIIDLDDGTLEYRELTANEALPIRLVADDFDYEVKRNEVRQTAEAAAARIIARMTEVRANAHLAYATGGMAGLKVLGATVHEGVPVTVDGATFPSPHFKATIDGVLCDMHCTKRAEAIKKASKELTERVASERAERTQASAEASRRLTAQDIQGKSCKSKKDAPKPGKSDGKNGKGKGRK